MSDADQRKAQVDTLRQQTRHIFDDLSEKTSQFELPKLPLELDEYRQKLATSTYSVLVVGEAKRGKSSFVNALIGRDLLPTDVDIATNQVFRVSHAEQEAYRLRFEDESSQAISAEELLEYGSQTVADRKGVSRFNLDLLRWIEVDVPIRFLPPGVSILDTPGMGSLYTAHAQITQRFVPHADAVIFVLDSNQPMVQFEVEFVEKILSATRHIFFIQTKIDLYDKEDWQRVQKRNEEILQEHFKDRLDDTRVWPISSRNLMKGAQTNSPGLLRVSRQEELISALEMFLFRVPGWNRCAEALLIADHYYTTSRETLAERLAALEAKSTQELSDMHQTAEQRRQQLEAEWGKDGKKRRELRSKVQKIVNSSKWSMIESIETGSKLEMSIRHKIDAVKSIGEANELGTTMFEQVATDVTGTWRIVCEQARLKCSMLLGSLTEDTNALILPPEKPNLAVYAETSLDIEDNLKDKLNQAQQGFFLGGSLAFLLIAHFVVWPIALVSVGVAGVWGAIQLWRISETTQVKEAQKELHNHLSMILEKVHKCFLDPDPKYDDQSLVNRYFDSLVQVMDEQIADIVEERSKEAQQESFRLEEQSKLDKQQRLAKAEKLREQLTAWDELDRSIRATADELKKVSI